MGRQAADLNVKYYINLCCMIVRNPHSTDFYPQQQQQKKQDNEKCPRSSDDGQTEALKRIIL